MPPLPVSETVPSPALIAPLTATVPDADKVTAPPFEERLLTEMLPFAVLKFNAKLFSEEDIGAEVVMFPAPVDCNVNVPPYPAVIGALTKMSFVADRVTLAPNPS